MKQISSRKKDHIDLCVHEDMSYRQKTNGFERYEFIHNALPEINASDISLQTTFLDKNIKAPIFISSMTGGYNDAALINTQLAEIAAQFEIPMGVGSQRITLKDSSHDHTYAVVRTIMGNDLPVFGNIGGAEIAQKSNHLPLLKVLGNIKADALAIHLNPLQELLQPEGNPNFRGVLSGIELFIKEYNIPVIVKEVGSGISASVARKLLDIGVHAIDVAGAGGTSWAGVEISRSEDNQSTQFLWDWGIPTADCLEMIRPLKQMQNFALFSSGGIRRSLDIAFSLALGADAVGMAGLIIKTLLNHGKNPTIQLIEELLLNLKRIMFLTGSSTISQLQSAEYICKHNSIDQLK